MWLKDLNFDEKILYECQSELASVDKEEFLKGLILERLEQCNREQMREFNEALDTLDTFIESDECSIKDLSMLIKKLSKYSKQLCDAELLLFSALEE